MFTLKGFHIIKLVLLMFFLQIPILAECNEIRVGIFLGRAPGDVFWQPLVNIAQAAANDLNIKLHVYWAYSNLIRMRTDLTNAITGKDKMDGILIYNFIGVGYSMLNLAEKHQVPTVIYAAGLDYKKVDVPQKKYKYWIFETLPDDEKAGYDLAEFLINKSKKLGLVGKDNKVHMIAISGYKASPASVERVKGLYRSLKGRSDTILHQLVYADWKKDKAQLKYKVLSKRYPEARVVWSASDLMSIGIIEEAIKMGRRIQGNLLTGGIDWTKEAFRSIQRGEMAASFGGHIWEGAWALILLHDWLKNANRNDKIRQFKTKMEKIDKQQIAFYEKHFFEENYQKVDFKLFSKYYNKNLKVYDFSLNHIYDQLKR